MNFPKAIPVLFLALCAIACDGATLTFGDGGTTSAPTNEASSPSETYASQYRKFTMYCARLQEILFSGSRPNIQVAADYCRSCVDALLAMQSFLPEPQNTKLNLVVENFRNTHDLLNHGRQPVTQPQLNAWEQEVVIRFSPSKVTLAATAPAPPAPSDPRPPEPVRPAPSPAPTQPAPAGPPPYWVMYTAWEKLHAELEAKWTAGEECADPYEKLVEILGMMSRSVTREQYVQLTVYTDYYRKLNKDTKGFKEVPKGATKQNVLDNLKAVAGSMELYFDPDRK